MSFSLKTNAHSEIGLVRTNNQDSAFYSPTMLVVADGMGGAAAGDLASAVAIRELRHIDEKARETNGLADTEVTEAMGEALSKANEMLADLVSQNHALQGMGTTVCGGYFDGSSLGIAHIGDSRGYLLRDGTLTQLTHDHSWVQSLVDEGKISAQEATTHPHRSLLLKVLNGQPTHKPDFQIVDLQLGDRLLFCSDGLCGMVDDQTIHDLLGTKDPAKAVRDLCMAAYRGGGSDNITLIVSDVVEQSDALDAVEPKVLGAAASVKIPDVNLKEPTSNLPPVPPPPSLNIADAPKGLIDPDAFEAIRYQPRLRSKRRRWIPWLIILVIVLALITASGYALGKDFVNSRYFIGTNQEKIALYHGVDYELFGHKLYELEKTSPQEVQYLPSYQRQQVTNRDLRGYTLEEDALYQFELLEELSAKCQKELAGKGEQANPAPASSASPSTSTSPSPNATSQECR
uniref:PP2C family protein-serine/threonine phosphatase n=1 Tax=Vaginimicrobium propionicum TaxID=1871034 RepID=UPI0009708F24|nr:protein phosphatase 2C domain-containing protein [Vaginimicrobium propionicum]